MKSPAKKPEQQNFISYQMKYFYFLLKWHLILFTFFFFYKGMSSVFFNKGENCIAAGRLFVEESIHDEYVERIVSTVYLL